MGDVLDACFSQGRQGLEVFHQNTGRQNNIVVPLTLLIFKHWNELKIGDPVFNHLMIYPMEVTIL